MKQIVRIIVSVLLLVGFAAPLSARDFVVVIDPGHGGKDAGALGRKAKEKDINLAVGLALGDMIKKNYKDVKVVYTRDDDYYITLQERANIANKAKGDLFISLHTNSVDRRSKNRNTVEGAETYTLGLHRTEENLEVAKRENSVIVLEDDYSTKYQGFNPNSTESYIIFELNQSKHMEQSVNFASLVQSEFGEVGRKDKGVRQAGFWVLAATTMPAVLVELDFICNPTQEAYLSSNSGQKELAGAIFKAFEAYKENFDYYNKGELVVASRSASHRRKIEEQQATETTSGEVEYRVQFMSLDRKLPAKSKEFKGLKDVDCYYDSGMYKYTTGATSDMAEAQKKLKKVREHFKDAFLIEMVNGKRVK